MANRENIKISLRGKKGDYSVKTPESTTRFHITELGPMIRTNPPIFIFQVQINKGPDLLQNYSFSRREAEQATYDEARKYADNVSGCYAKDISRKAEVILYDESTPPASPNPEPTLARIIREAREAIPLKQRRTVFSRKPPVRSRPY